MRHGRWVPISKALVSELPKGRTFTKLEAMFSLSIDYENNKKITLSGCAARWGWSRKKTKKFIDDIGVEIQYPENTSKKQNQKGQIGLQIRNRSGTDQEQIRFIDSKDLEWKRNRSGTDQGQIRDRSGSTTIDPKNLEPNPNPINSNSQVNSIPKKKPKQFDRNSDEFRLAEYLLNHIRKNKPDFKQPNLQAWARDADLMLRIDNRSLEASKKLIKWVQNDFFEKKVVLSMSKIRSRFDSLEMKMRGKNEMATKINNTPRPGYGLSEDYEFPEYEEVDWDENGVIE